MVQQTNRSNNTNKYNPQEQGASLCASSTSSNNTNKYNPQELFSFFNFLSRCSNNTNKYNPQEHLSVDKMESIVQIIRINTILKNTDDESIRFSAFK